MSLGIVWEYWEVGNDCGGKLAVRVAPFLVAVESERGKVRVFVLAAVNDWKLVGIKERFYPRNANILYH